MQLEQLTRDESGRLLGPDGWPVGGLASVHEITTATGLSRSAVYKMISDRKLPVKRFGRSVRVSWQVVRSVFFDGA